MDANFYKRNNIRLDLAVEAREVICGQTGQEIPGCRMDKETYTHATVTTVHIEEDYAEQLMGKPQGTYITIEAPAIRDNNRQIHQEIVEIFARQLASLFNLPEHANVLVVGLGNWNATPDALGPKVVGMTLVTRHMYNYAPSEIRDGMRSVSALSPGVLGLTGIETAEIIKGVVDRIKPELIIAVDALAARAVERIGTTIQLADTGIAPGSGVGNKRAGINQASMGVPVIAIGVPTVVPAAIIAGETLDRLAEQTKDRPELQGIYQFMNSEAIQPIVNAVLQPYTSAQLMVTPKEIDTLIENTAKIIAGGISLALHPAITADEYSQYLQ
ncbi:GPR endopeptidase [Desulforamulus hydrothermalis]|uniref:Germination protease n=1 Tax=Desulforamulus hydrothermalis Lam5 = DSM 18033 TaxID=1121428 RepID=K8EIS2_9FIRM|nr:GPR endopeptidase [Desulforamulus hydrothermalis]CCO08511.1 Germination protease [Desulforamulus hydrothermalis Lam5 = DSM 18033]SHH29928.1 spore protease [Desulforamulus hydrothermalis Lam5 = DSM 18033]